MANRKSKLSRLVDALPDLLHRAEDYNETCLSCNGQGITYKKIDVYAPCHNCNSTGRVPFVDNMIPKSHPPDLDVMMKIAQRNVHILTDYIRSEYAMVGIEVQVRFEFPNPNRGEIARLWEKRNLDPTIYPEDGNIEEKLIFEAPPRRKL